MADAQDPDEILMMIANNHAKLEDPVDNNHLPYFWRGGAADGVERVLTYNVYAGFTNTVRHAAPYPMSHYSYSGAGAVLSYGPFKAGVPHVGRRALGVEGFAPGRMPDEGFGWWTPSLPARPGDAIKVRFRVRGEDLLPRDGDALSAFVRFTDYTGRQRRDIPLETEVASHGTFDWIELRFRHWGGS